MHKRPTNLIRVGLVLAGILSVACTDSAGPDHDRGAIGAPSFSYSASGITLRTDNGAMNYTGRLIRKGFDHRDANGQVIHPLPGDAVVATFYWIGAPNIIDSVSDVYTDAQFTPIGNSYHLVDYVQTRGINMATYVATNVHFDTTSGYVFAVQATFRDTISIGGVKMVDWSGVEDVYPTALGAFHSDSVVASTPTPVAPGPITIGAGSVAYGVTLSNGGVNMQSRPTPNWVIIGGGIGSSPDGRLQDDGGYFPPGEGGSINPQWTWDFQHASAAVATVLELRPGTSGSTNQPPVAAFTSSCSNLTCNFTNTSSDPDGSISANSWSFDDGQTSTVASPSHSYSAAGTYTVTLTVTDNQGATNSVSHSVTVTAPNQPPVASFTKSCSGLTCGFTSTSSDPDGSITVYSWTFGDGGTSTAQNPSHTYAAGGTYTVTLRVTDNQGAQSTTTSQSVTVTTPNSPPVVNAGPDENAVTGLLYSTSFSFSDATPNGPWSYRIDWGDGSVSTGTRPGPGSFTVGHTYIIILPRSFTVRVTVTDAAGASGSDTKVVSVFLL